MTTQDYQTGDGPEPPEQPMDAADHDFEAGWLAGHLDWHDTPQQRNEKREKAIEHLREAIEADKP